MDLELAKTLIRPGSLFIQDLAKAKEFSSKGYGSVRRANVVCNEDKATPEDSVELTKMKVERRTIRMTWKVLLLILLIIASQVLNGGCSRLLHNGTDVSQARGPGSPSGPCNCSYVPGGGN